jgi:hypothetical protein
VTTEIGQASDFPKEELEMFKDIPYLAASDIADAVIYVLGTPPHVQVSIKCKAIPATRHGGPYDFETSRLPHFVDNLLTDSGEVVSLTRRPPFTPERFLVLISVGYCVDHRATVRLEEFLQMKNPVTSTGIKPTTFWLEA